MAREIAIQSNNLIEYTRKQNKTCEIVQRALLIVRVAAGARTTDVMIVRDWRYSYHKNVDLEKVLHTGALIDEDENTKEEKRPDAGGER